MSAHTPGPWMAHGAVVRAIDHGKWFTVADCRQVKLTPEGMIDNAQLIAAAPEMFKALQRLTHPAADDDDLAYALEVIAKATGDTV